MFCFLKYFSQNAKKNVSISCIKNIKFPFGYLKYFLNYSTLISRSDRFIKEFRQRTSLIYLLDFSLIKELNQLCCSDKSKCGIIYETYMFS